MINYYFFIAAGQSQSYEIVVAFVIIIATLFAVFFLYRNVMNTIQTGKKEKEALSNGNIVNDVMNSEIFSKINHDIHVAHEGTTRFLYSIDLDNFSYYANMYKDKVIKKIIKEIETRLKEKAKPHHFASHLKYDKFIFYYKENVETKAIQQVANELLSIIGDEPYKVDNIRLSASIGVSLFPEDGRTADTLLGKANLAVQLAKKHGKNGYFLYSEEHIEKERFNIDYYQDIKRSIENNEFILYYQPIVDLEKAQIIGLESLLRWEHPELGVLVPSKFLKQMDVTGNIMWFGLWGFEKVVSKYKEWSKDFKVKDLFISINLSPKQLEIQNLAQTFFEIIKKYDLDANNFVFEVLEYYIVSENDIGKQNIIDFRKFGFKVALDEFGDNYQLIDEIQNVETDIVKIPRLHLNMMLENYPASEKIKALIQASQKNDKMVIIEGIETEVALNKVKEWNLKYAQGYYFSEPVDVETAKKMVKKTPWKSNSFRV
jgi:diguanylate cyclase (GGDEF)-like protein